ncbi:MAG: Acetyl-CoA synthetase (ADP-forming) [Candidatus Fermentimicrarchaeum limneticum]|uniref:Acetyl-CoA synthetase (ADP-forming) n=1 Tax=Fermentimicrarchaeum limneticum TaxID=2795018 RepID=A0A7D6BEV8_FERL1|nr:MAG: Acetyl-CoA synthetase (ADP-forming) [Candidatus Fermentimicrarchaeum limneticum]
MNIDVLFNPNSVAVIGASRDPGKIGHVLLRNFIEGGFRGQIYPINPKSDEILGLKCYLSVNNIKGDVDLAVIAIPANFVPDALRECGEKGVKGAIVISGGFSEVGNVELENELKEVCAKYDIACLGPNCMGVINPLTRVDSVFIPTYKMGRPKLGGVSFISQSGAIGGAVLDLMARQGFGMSKFVSYGNGAVLDETDLLRYMADDERTRIIVLYIEGVRRGREFFETLKGVTKRKPVVVLKGGKTAVGAAATKSHTGSLAGNAAVYDAVFKQCKATEARNLDEIFNFSKLFESQPFCNGERVGIITNGGGLAVIASDSVEENGLKIASLSEESRRRINEKVPAYVNVRNPLDLSGDAGADRFEVAVQAMLEDSNVDALLVGVLFQTESIDSRVVSMLVEASNLKKKPLLVVCPGGEYAEVHGRILENCGVPTYTSSASAVRSLRKLVDYSKFMGKK